MKEKSGKCFGVTKEPNESDYMLIFWYDVLEYNLSEVFGEIIWECKIDELIDKLFDLLNEIDNKESYLKTVETANLSNELFETLKIIENCSSCIDNRGNYNFNFDRFHKLTNKIENLLAELEREEKKENTTSELNYKLYEIDDKLNQKVLCESCKRRKIEKLTDKCENKEMAKLLYEFKLDADDAYLHYIRWIPFNEFINIEYLAKGGFGEVHKATWISYIETTVVLKRIYNFGDKIISALKEVKKKFFF